VAMDEMERAIIEGALQRCDYNAAAAARLLGTTHETLRYRIQKYGLRRESAAASAGRRRT
jgi:DNA-binding NtrC family response regulator